MAKGKVVKKVAKVAPKKVEKVTPKTADTVAVQTRYGQPMAAKYQGGVEKMDIPYQERM